jgi:hypothetical protein
MCNFDGKLDMIIAISACFWTSFSWNTFFHTFILSLFLSLPLSFCKKQMFGSCFLIQSSSLCLLNGELRQLAFRILTEMYAVVIDNLLFVLCLITSYSHFLIYSSCETLLSCIFIVALTSVLCLVCIAALVVMFSLIFVYYKNILFLPQFWKITVLDSAILFSSDFPKEFRMHHSMPSLILEFLYQNLLLFWWVCFCISFGATLLHLSTISLSSLYLIFYLQCYLVWGTFLQPCLLCISRCGKSSAALFLFL